MSRGPNSQTQNHWTLLLLKSLFLITKPSCQSGARLFCWTRFVCSITQIFTQEPREEIVIFNFYSFSPDSVYGVNSSEWCLLLCEFACVCDNVYFHPGDDRFSISRERSRTRGSNPGQVTLMPHIICFSLLWPLHKRPEAELVRNLWETNDRQRRQCFGKSRISFMDWIRKWIRISPGELSRPNPKKCNWQ